MVANNVLCDATLSLKAKGLFAYIYSKPDDWDFSSERIVLETYEGIDAIKAALHELEEHGYLVRKRRSDGRMEYHVTFTPLGENPSKGNSLKGKSPRINKTESYTKKEEDTKNNATTDVVASPSEYPLPKEPGNFIKNPEKKLDGNITMTKAEFILYFRSSQFRFLRIIAEYADDRKEINYTTRGQWREFVRRNLRTAKRLVPFTDKQLVDAMGRMSNDMREHGGYLSRWTLETLEKYLQ